MAKLSQLLTLESMLKTYDNLNINDAWVIENQGKCVERLVDVIIEKLNRQLNSKTRLSCRNVLVANFETMTKTEHWLKSKLFIDLPKALSKVLRDKMYQMVDLLKALILKIIDVDADFADRFFERMKKRCRKYSTTGYDLWKAQQSEITIKGLVTRQVDLTADMLLIGILENADTPNGEDIQNVDKDKLALKLTNKSIMTDAFICECAKLRRYSHWEGDMFIIDYHKLRKYLFCEFGKLTYEQHIKMYEYDIQMKQIHEDIKRLKEEEMSAEDEKKMKVKKEEKIVLCSDENNLLAQLSPMFYGSEDNAKEFLGSIRGMKGKQITDMVNMMITKKKLSELSCHRDLYTVLHNAGIYDKSESNWNMQVK